MAPAADAAPSEVPPPPPPVYRRPPPPYYVYEPPPPPAPRHRAPVTSLWAGVRGGILFPGGYLYDLIDRNNPLYLQAQRWSGLASSGPSAELNLGARFARRYIVYGLWERAWLGEGGEPVWRQAFGDQKAATTDLAGLGLRWSSNPDEAGLLVDLALGYRWFHEEWADGTKADMRGLGEVRVGIGADIRISRQMSISPVFALSEGVFHERSFEGPRVIPTGDYSDSHNTLSMTLGLHYDFAPSPSP
jgi:hypothetical protein